VWIMKYRPSENGHKALDYGAKYVV